MTAGAMLVGFAIFVLCDYICACFRFCFHKILAFCA